MTENYDMGKLGVIAPFKAKEGTITITTGASAHGDVIVPVLSAGLKKGDLVELDGNLTVKKATTSGTPIGIVYNVPKWETEPRQNYTQAQAVSADQLREVGIETVFKKILTVSVKNGEAIAVDDSLEYGSTNVDELEKANSATDIVALTAQTTDNKVVAGFI